MLGSASDGSESNRPTTVRQPSEAFEDLPESLEGLPFEADLPDPLSRPPAPRASQRKPRRARLTDDLVETLEPGPVQFYVWDLRDKGLGVRIGATGKRSFVVKVSLPGGRSKWLTLEAETVAEARLEYLQRRLDFGKGKGAPKKRQEVLWQAVVDRFADEHLKTVRFSSAATYRGPLDHAREAFQDRPLQTLRYGDLWALHEAMSATPRQANVTIRLIGMIFNRAIAWDLWDPQGQGLTPSERLKMSAWKPYREEPRNRPLSDDELARLGAALAVMEATARMQVAAVRLLVFTGKRLREILDLRWSQVDLSTRTIRWAQSKTGPMTAPLNDAALGVLQALPRLILTTPEGEAVECPYVLPTATGRPIRDLTKFWNRLLVLAQIEDAHRHDLRHAHGNEAAGLGLSLQIVSALLGHRDAHTSERYSKVQASEHPALAASQAVAASLSRKMGGER